MKDRQKELITPCGIVTVVDRNGHRVPFTLRKNLFDCPYTSEDAAGKMITRSTDTNYDLVVKASDLIKGAEYRILLKGTPLQYGDSDEHTECVSGCSNGHYIAIGAWLPNDEEELRQAFEYSEKMGYRKHNSLIEPPRYDTSKFIKYSAEMLPDCSGFSFYLIDDTTPEITFSVAWIKSNGVDESECEGAVQFWTT